MGFAARAGPKLDRQPATLLSRFTTRSLHLRRHLRIHKLRLQLEEGTQKNTPHAPLYDAVGTRTDVPVTVEIDPDNDLIDAVYLEGHRYATGRQSAAVVIMFLILLSGVFLLLRGIGRGRRARLGHGDPPHDARRVPPATATRSWSGWRGYMERVGELPIAPGVAPGEIRRSRPPRRPQAARASLADLLRDLDEIVRPGITDWRFSGAVCILPGQRVAAVDPGRARVGRAGRAGDESGPRARR